MNNHNEGLQTLIAMGFDEQTSQLVLANTNGDVSAAINVLLATTDNHDDNGGGSNNTQPFTTTAVTETTTTTNAVPTVIQSSFSQYDIPNGRSACTCIAVSMASEFLKSIDGSTSRSITSTTTTTNNNNNNRSSAEQLITTSFLETNLRSGVQIYNTESTQRRLGPNSGSSSSIEHLSPEEVLSGFSTIDFGLRLVGSVRQGIVSSVSSFSSYSATTAATTTMGFREIFRSICDDRSSSSSSSSSGNDRNKWTAVVVTKTPESICVFLPPPPPSSSSSSPLSKREKYVLIDSHPRPEMGRTGCHAEFWDDMDGLIRGLESRFPAVDLGMDVGEMMAIMYNSFDVYPLQKA